MSILSIQSHVAYGYVGNRVASFVLQRMGLEVFAVNTVQFSNHTGYGKWQGMIFSGEHIELIIKGLNDLGVMQDSNSILTGYLGSSSIGNQIADIIKFQKQQNTDLIYLCDPVIGDINRGIFVQTGVPDIFKSTLVALADIITPNHFEFQYLTDRTCDTYESVLDAIPLIPNYLTKIILITSFRSKHAPQDEIEILMYYNEKLYSIKTTYFSFSKDPNGTGDLFSALYLGQYILHQSPLIAFERAVGIIFSILELSYTNNSREVQLILAQDYIIHPKHTFEAQLVLRE